MSDDPPTCEAAVSVENVSKRFVLGRVGPTSFKERLISRDGRGGTEFWALSDVSLRILKGETFGLLGHNGSGKSTLLKCVARTLSPTSGTIRTVGSVTALLELGAGFHPDLTGVENVELNASILGLDNDEVRRRMPAIFQFAELEEFAHTPVKNYSSGMFARLGFAVAMFLEPDVLLVDEVLSVGDESFQRKCMGEVRRFQREGRTIVVVTHSADLVREVCDRAAVLEDGKVLTVAEPPAAIRVMRDTYVRRGLAVPGDLASADNLRQSSTASFGELHVSFPEEGRDWLYPGEPLEVSVEVVVREETDDLVVALEIFDDKGTKLTAVNTDRLGAPPGSVTNSSTVIFRLESVPLLGGSYHLTLGLHDHDIKTSFDQREQFVSFRVENTSGLVGLVDIPITANWKPGI